MLRCEKIDCTNHLWFSYQIEGAAEQDGRGPSIWDVFCKTPGKIADGSSGDVACDSYNRTAQDIDLLKLTGAKAYRFSLSWSRIIPLGGRNDPINHKGLQFYVKFVDDLLAAGITPMITLFHWDLPDGLHKRYGGMLNREEFPKDFAHYAKVVFEAIPKCKHWITFNEPWCSAILGYNTGFFAPGRTSDRSKSTHGDSARECWIVGHNILLAHGAAVKVYREQFKPKNGGEIGITLNGEYFSFHDGRSNRKQAMLHIPGILTTQKTLKHAIEKSSSPSPGSQTLFTSVTTLLPCANNWAIGFPNSRQKKKR